MSISVLASYSFVYFVLFLIVPALVIVFVMTCAKFFKESVSEPINISATINTDKVVKYNSTAIGMIAGLAKGKYNVIYGAAMESLVDVSKGTDKNTIDKLKACLLDCVVLDKSSSIKLVVSNPKHNTIENNDIIDTVLSNAGIKVIKISDSNDHDALLINAALA